MPWRNEPLMLKQRLGLARGRFGFVSHSVIQQKTGSILRCRLPFVVFWTALVYLQMSMGGRRPSSLLHWAVCIMFSLISVLASRVTPPHWPERRRIYLIYPHSSQWAEDVRVGMCVWGRTTNLESLGSVFERTCEGMHTLCMYVCMLPTCHKDVKMADAYFRTKRFREPRRKTQQQQIKSLVSQLLSSKTRQLGHADKRRIDICSDTRVAAVHVVSLSCGCCERELCQTQSRLAGKCRVKQWLSFSSR